MVNEMVLGGHDMSGWDEWEERDQLSLSSLCRFSNSMSNRHQVGIKKMSHRLLIDVS